MKKIYILSLILSCSLFSYALDLKTNIGLEGLYQSNVLSLSDSDYQKYLDGEIGSSYDIESADDFVSNLSVDLKAKHKLLGHTNLYNLKFDYELYSVNKVFDKFSFAFDTKYYFNRNLDLEIGYRWSPEIYVNNYTSVWDDERHQYTYSKNDYSSRLNWDLNKRYSLQYDFSYSQLFYNEYFTEYDSNVIENGINLIADWKNLNIKAGYSYKLSEAQAADAFDDISYEGVIKDASYDSNKYRFSFSIPKIFAISDKNVKFYTSILWEQRYFSSNFEDDTYHYGREAERFSLNSYLRYYLNKTTSLKIVGKFQNRNTDSVYDEVAKEKTYDAYQVGFNLDFKL